MKDVFISYSSNDYQTVKKLCDLIEHNGIECWMAPRDVSPGMPYPEEIVKGISKAKVVLLVASISINSSEQILNEIEIATNKNKVILPFKIDEVEFNDNYRYYLNRKHWIEANPHPSEHYQELISSLKYLLQMKEVDRDTINNEYLKSLSERNRLELEQKYFDSRLSYSLSIKNDEYPDECHYYEHIKRVDVLDQETGMYNSYRWLTIKNVSDTPTTFVYHKESGENKIKAEAMKFRAKQLLGDGKKTKLITNSVIDLQPSFVQAFKIYFHKPLAPEESCTIFMSLAWPGELHALCDTELSHSISFTRYKIGVGTITFGLLNTTPSYGYELIAAAKEFQEVSVPFTPRLIQVQEDPDLKPLHNRQLSGVYYDIPATENKSYRIFYKLQSDINDIDDDDDDF